MKYYLIRSLSLAFAMLSTPIMAQQKTISGTVVDEHGQPLVGVDVVVMSTKRGVSTDFDGNFSIEVSRGERLKFTYIGYKPKVVKVSAFTALNVPLVPVEKTLEEVVVVGYGERNKAELSSAISRVDVKKSLEQTNFSNVAEALSGSVAGISVSAGSGQPGSNTLSFIRGVGSINAGSRPLYVINDVPIVNYDMSSLSPDSNPLAALDPNMVKSVTLLKDASAVAIYGARGSNGVILITTKSGTYNQDTRISYRSEYSLGDIAFDKFKPLNAEEWVARFATALFNTGQPAKLSAAKDMIVKSTKWDGKSSTDWKKYTMPHKAMVLSNNVNISGGAEKTKYNLGVGAYTNKGLPLRSDFKRYAANLSLTHRYSDKLSFGTNLNVAHANQNSVGQGGLFANPIMARYIIPSVYSPYNEDGSYTTRPGHLFNPVAIAKFDKNQAQQLFLNGNAYAVYRFLGLFKFRSAFSANYIHYDEKKFNSPLYGDGASVNGRGFDNYNTRFIWDWSNVLNFRKRLGIHNFDMDLGMSITEQRDRYIQAVASNYAFSNLTALANTSVKETISSDRTLTHFRSYFTRLTYTLHDKYSVTGTYRRDGSSRFRPSKKFGNFWAVSGAWELNRESFIGDFFDDLKLRASYGTTGNAEIGNFAYMTRVSSMSAGHKLSYNDDPGITPVNVGSSDLSWESKQQLDLGLDLAVFSKRLQFVFDYYSARSYDLLLDVPLSLTTGLATQSQNLGELVNRGFEFSLSGYPIRKRDFSWNTKAVFSINNSEITDLGGLTFTDVKALAVGQSLGAWYMRGWAGVDRDTGGPLWYTDATETKTTADYDRAKRYYHGNSIPRYVGGITHTLQYKGASLSFSFDYKGGYKVYDSWAFIYDSDGEQMGFNGRKEASQDRWTKEHKDAKYPKFVFGGGGDISNSNDASSRYLYDGDFIRLRRVELSYTLPQKLVADLKLKDFTLYVKATNLWTYAFDKDLYFDSESFDNFANEDQKDRSQWEKAGYFNLTQPVMRYYGMGVRITF